MLKSRFGLALGWKEKRTCQVLVSLTRREQGTTAWKARPRPQAPTVSPKELKIKNLIGSGDSGKSSS